MKPIKYQTNDSLPALGQRLFLLFLLLTIAWGPSAIAQDGIKHTVAYSGWYKDIKIPNTLTSGYLELKATGGDGGVIDRVVTWQGGKGATVAGLFEIGTAADQLQAGGTIRFIVGGQGESDATMRHADPRGVGGGGGTGIAYKGPRATDKWHLLIVAGGGGGSSWGGGEGTSAGPGLAYSADAIGNGKGGEAYGGGGAFSASAKAEKTRYAGAGWENGPDSGEPTGGTADKGSSDTFYSGGYGFGAGGLGKNWNCAGGGGGYSGGDRLRDDAANCSEGAGGTSYFNEELNSFLLYTKENGTTRHPANGSASYAFSESVTIAAIQLANHTDKCAAISRSGSGGNVQLAPYSQDASTRRWLFLDQKLQGESYPGKCLDINGGGTDNGTNIQIWDCNGGANQKWIYDGVFGTIRSYAGFRKCLSLEGSSSNSPAGTNIHLWECKEDNVRQQWQIDGATKVDNPSGVKTIRPVAANGMCLNLQDANSDAGNNVRLWTCNNPTTEWQGWRFDLDGQIHLAEMSDKCLGVMDQTNNVHIWNCQDNNFGQVWIYDGINQSFRWTNDSSKCLQVDLGNGSYEKRDNLIVAACDGGEDQRFEVR